MDSAPDDLAYVRVHIHQLAFFLSEFIETVRHPDMEEERTASYREGNGRHVDEPNLAAYLQNMDVTNAVSPLLPFSWAEYEDEPPAAIASLVEILTAILTRWGLAEYIKDGFPYMKDGFLFSLEFLASEPEPFAFTPQEETGLYRALKGLDWLLFTLPAASAGSASDREEAPPVSTGDEAIDRLFSPVFFRTRMFLNRDDMALIGESMADLKSSPAVYEAYQTHVFRESFRIGQPGRHPDQPRLVDIAARARVFLVAVETCLPVEGDGTAGPVGLDPAIGEFYVCESASALCDVLDGPDGEAGESSVAFAHGWNTEVNFGLRSLDALVGQLLTRWRVAEWEWRLSQGKPGAHDAVSIRPDELAGLRRVVETIEKGIARLGIDATVQPPRPTAEARAKGGLDKQWKIIMAYHDHPEWSLAQIAAEAKAHRGHVSRVLKPIRAREGAERRNGMPKGYKDQAGDFDAWTA